jgi:flagellar basal-body rod protein FlgB
VFAGIGTMIDFDRDTAFTQRLLDALDARAKASLHNIANQNVPGFKRQEVRFEEQLKKQMEQGSPLGDVKIEVNRDDSGPKGVNNVSLVEEAALLDKTKLLHEFATRRMGSYFGTINKAIFGR